MTLFALFKVLHVASAIWLVGGALGRGVALYSARRAPQMRILKAIADVSGQLENLMIAPGIFAVFITGIATAIAGGFSLFGPFGGGPLWVFIPLIIMLVAIVTTPITLGHDRAWGQALEEAARQDAVTDRLRGFLDRNAMLRRYVPDIAFVAVIVVLMSIFLLMKLLHVASAMWLVGGLVARFLALGAASRSGDIRTTQALTELGGKFETRMVIPASMTLLVTGIVAALLGGFPLLGPVQGGPWWLLVSLILYFASIVLVPTVFLPRGRVFRAALDDAVAHNHVTPGLQAAFADRAVVRSHRAEFIGIAVIVVLMVLKPF